MLPNFQNRQYSLEDVHFSSYVSPILPGVKQAVEAVIEDENHLQKGQKPITQTFGENVLKVCVNEPPNESHSNQHTRPLLEQNFEAAQNKRKSVCSLSIKRNCFALALLVTPLTIFGIFVALIFQGKLSDIRIFIVQKS